MRAILVVCHVIAMYAIVVTTLNLAIGGALLITHGEAFIYAACMQDALSYA
jgi:hypothetical protein